MKKAIVLLVMSVALSALVDLIHGQHNGDIHRTYIHAVEFVLLLLLLSALTLQAYETLTRKLEMSGWAAASFLSSASLVVGFSIFGLSGGSVHGDGGPIATGFGITGFIGMLGLPVTLVGWLVALLLRRHRP